MKNLSSCHIGNRPILAYATEQNNFWYFKQKVMIICQCYVATVAVDHSHMCRDWVIVGHFYWGDGCPDLVALVNNIHLQTAVPVGLLIT